ncbi:MAG: hypothetical protein J6R71_05985, partial [Bacteroidales bacterium]|nr:hypothetical protein [Bacteroidales bacterium]
DFRAACNGDATSLEMFHEPKMHAFNGKLVVIVQSNGQKGDIILKVAAKGLASSSITIKAE